MPPTGFPPASAPAMAQIENEQHKLLAGFFNGVAVASVAIGVIAPLGAVMLGVTGYEHVGRLALLVGLPAWLGRASIFHALGRRVLRRLRP